MEIIRIPGYTEDEKIQIARRHLIPKQMKAHGLKDDEWKITDDGVRDLIRYYSREAGVRNLEREIANLTRKAVKEILSKKTKSLEITADNLGTYAGVRRHRFGEITGLAWTEVGGETLTIESVMLPGKGRFQATGKLGDVMKESIDAARSYVRSKATSFGIKPPLFDKVDIHVHVPEGATPKDGPSAGLAMATSIISVITGIPIRRDVAMTGEVTLRGRALPIGGLKEKLLAALRAGITTVIIPKDNEKDLADVPDNVKTGLTIVPVSTMGEVLAVALVRQPEAIDWVEPEVTAALPIADGEDTVVTH
jgi:ATP-dependent Lon protease